MTSTTGRPTPVSPDCIARKHLACVGNAWDDPDDRLAECHCGCHSRERAS